MNIIYYPKINSMDKTPAKREAELKEMIKTQDGKGYVKRRFLELKPLPAGRFVAPLKSFLKMIEDILDDEFREGE
jgi:hypothetical protein